MLNHTESSYRAMSLMPTLDSRENILELNDYHEHPKFYSYYFDGEFQSYKTFKTFKKKVDYILHEYFEDQDI